MKEVLAPALPPAAASALLGIKLKADWLLMLTGDTSGAACAGGQKLSSDAKQTRPLYWPLCN